MTQKLKRVFGRVDVRVLLVLGFLAAAFFVAIAQEKAESSYDVAEYEELLSHRLDSVYDLEHWFAAQQEALLPILPPYADCVLTNQTGLPEILPFTAEKFPKDFREGLAGIYEYSVPVYPVRLVEDTKTRALLFYNYDGKLFYTLEAASEYDPFSYLKDLMPWLYAGRANSAGMAYWEGLYDPARIQIVTKLIAAEDMEHWLYAKAKVEAAAEALEDEGGGSMMMRVTAENSTTNIVFTEIKKVTNGVSMTVAYPSWFTNRLDIFMCSELPPEIWSFATLSLPTTGTNLTWVDTNNWVTMGNPTRLYAASDATMDSDGDGYQDGREIMVYDTDPNVATSRPVKVSGTISYGGPESGTIYILFSTQSNNWSLAKSMAMSNPGAYTNDGIGNHQSYWFNAFRDVNGNFTRDAWEPWGSYSQNSTLITGDTSGINITLHDVPSVWGQISYSGTATGDIHVIAVASSNSWESTYETIIPYVSGVGPSGEQYFVTFPASYQITGLPASNYWIRAFMDVDTNGVPSEVDPSGQYAAAATGVSNRVTGVNVTLIADSDSDGLPDWWEYLYFAGLGQDGGDDPDGDGFDNALEYELKSKPASAKWNGQQLAYKILHAHASSGPGLRSPHPEGMHVDIEDSVGVDCGGSNDEVQNKGDPLEVPEMEASGYFMDITVEGKVEDHQSEFDIVTFEACTNTFFFQGHEHSNECAMASESATRNVLILQNTSVTLRYDTVDALYHVGAYAEVTAATETGALTVEMTRPDDKANSRYFHYAFNDASPGVCEVACKVNITPDTQEIRNQLQDKVQWSIDAVQGSALTWQNGGSGPGKGVYYAAAAWEEKAIYTTLPNNNTEFGIKEATVAVTGFCCSQDGKAKVFYARNEKNHPGQGAGQTPNWYFYWSQTSASGGTHEYYGPGSDGNGRSYAAFISGQWRARIGNGVETGPVTINGITYPKGIDNFAFTTRHEEQHRVDLIALWGASSDRNPANDLDDDFLPDNQETNLVPNHPYSPNLSATYPDTWGYGQGWRDVEDYALLRQGYPTPGDYDSVDWAYPGNQWDPAAGDPAHTEY